MTKPQLIPLASAALLALLFGFMPIFGGVDSGHLAVAILLAAAATCAMIRIAFQAIGGQTGDVAGAAQQLAEITYLWALVATPGV